MEDVRSWLIQPSTGTIETAGASWWRLLPSGIRVVTIRRPVAEVVDSLMRLGLPFNRDVLTNGIQRLDRKLDQVEVRIPDVLSVQFSDLAGEDTCAKVFEHCLPYRHDHNRWSAMAPINIQINMRTMLRYAVSHAPQTLRLAEQAKQQMLSDLHQGSGFIADGITISEESFDAYFPRAIQEIREHAVRIGLGSDYPDQMNFEMMKQQADTGCLQTVIARCNGRVLGYLLTVLQSCFNNKNILAAHHGTIWASNETRGLSLRMYRVSNDLLRQKGYGEIIYRAGPIGDGPRLVSAFKRLGAEPCGYLYRQDIQEKAA